MSAIDIIVFDKTGVDGAVYRRDILARSFLEKRVACLQWDGKAALSADSLLFAHASDCNESGMRLIGDALSRGASVVFYTGGAVHSGPQVKGLTYWFQWEELQSIVRRLPSDFELSDFERVVLSFGRRDVLNAIAIFAKCASLQPRSLAMKSRQEPWRTDAGMWQRSLNPFGEGDVRVAMDIAAGARLPDELSEVGALIDWIWPRSLVPSGAAPPDFGKLLEQLEGKFGFCA